MVKVRIENHVKDLMIADTFRRCKIREASLDGQLIDRRHSPYRGCKVQEKDE